MTHHALYRFFDRHGQLLYVGMTFNPAKRWSQHRRDKPWWSEVVQINVQAYPDRPSVRAAELEAIKAERPLYNQASNPSPIVWTSPPPLARPVEPPVIHVLEVLKHRDGYSAKIRCPHCNLIHTHGLGRDGTDAGHRQAHCADPATGGYFLVLGPPGQDHG